MAPVFLSHVYVVVDQVSYDAIRHSDAIRSLASAGEKTCGINQGNWTAFYIAGRQTVIELVAAGPMADGGRCRLGQSGIGLGWSGADTLGITEKHLHAILGDRVRQEVSTRSTPNGAVPWFPEIDVEGSDKDVLSTWFFEISPGYFIARYPGTRVRHLLSRQQYFAASYLPDRLLDDLVGLTVALNPAETAVLIEELKVAGWMARSSGDKTVVSGPDVAITIVPAGARAGVREAVLRLRRPAPPQEASLGSAHLFLAGQTGHLSFWNPN